MPTYDYQCDACDHKFELFQSISEPVKKTCPECGKKKLRRLFGTGAAIMFKGSGFYQTDYRSESYKKGAAADSKSGDAKSGDGKSGDSKSSDAKSADAKGESKSSGTKPADGKGSGKKKGKD